MSDIKINKTSRRDFLKIAGATGAVSAFAISGCASMGPSGTGPRVVVVGGGFGGSTAARYVKKFGPDFRVTLIEPKTSYVTCPFSNPYLGGVVDLKTITHGYDGLKKAGVHVVHDMVTGMDAANGTVSLSSGGVVEYDRLVVSPGIDFKWGMGYDEAASLISPHAWQGGSQTVMLKKQLEEMDDGGTVIICPPGNPFRCPPGPYERASMIAHYLNNNKPRSKVLILDRKDKFSKQGAFMEGWKKNYTNIEWVKATDVGTITSVDASARTVHTEMDTHKAGVLNFIPNQKAGKIAHTMGLTGGGDWCPVDQITFESLVIPGVHVIGDAAVVKGLPKSGNAANSEAKVCAWAVVQLLSGASEVEPALTSNTCYSLVTPDYGISVTAVWKGTTEKYAKTGGGVSPADQSADFRSREAEYAHGWYANITHDIWG
ncbi:MAG: FCSD flavin-binding domain-containing protein [Rhodospirillaceae bacterium]|nr:FCSD flavin-binding domain-containing protein [Rhodospirillaceae bacterium]